MQEKTFICEKYPVHIKLLSCYNFSSHLRIANHMLQSILKNVTFQMLVCHDLFTHV